MSANVTPARQSAPSADLHGTLPALPVELHDAILALADTQTLARCCSVSMAFLELASPLLYQHVHIDGVTVLGQPFCDRVSPPSRSVLLLLSSSRADGH